MRVGKPGKILLFCFAGLLALLLPAMLAVKIVLDRAPAYQSEIKAWVHAQTGYHIDFSGVSPAFRWYGPELHFERLELRSRDDRRVLARAAGGRVAVDIWQLIRSGKLLAGRVQLDSPNIVIARQGPTSFALASEIELRGQESATALNLDDLPAGRLVISHGVITLQKWNAALPELILRDVNLDVRRGAADVTLMVTARLPEVLGGTLSFHGEAHGRGDWQSLDWTAQTRTFDMVFRGWRALLPEYLSRLDAGTGAFELAARGRGWTLERADLDFGARGVVTQTAGDPNTKFEQISGELTIIHADDRWDLTGKRIRALRAGRSDPDSQFAVSWRAGDAGLLGLRVHASYLRADTLMPLSGLLPQKELRNRLRDLAPTGEWSNAAIVMARDAAQDPWRLQMQADFRDAGIAPLGHAPGMRGLTGSVAGNERGGRLDIDAHHAVFAWPWQLAEPVELQTFATTLYWKRTPEELLIATPKWQLKTRDVEAGGQMAWRQPSDGESPVLTLLSKIENGNAANARNYLPRALLPAPALAWLDRAFVAGHLSRADAVFQGPVRQFPFRDGGGLFLARCALDALTLDYQEGWPRVENASGTAEFRNEGLRVHVVSGHIGDLELPSAEARFADFKNAELEIRAGGRADASSVLAFLRATPLDAAANHGFSAVDAKGPLDSKVDLFLPFKEFGNRRVLVHSHLAGVTLSRPGSPSATDITGDLDIDGVQVARADIRGRALGGTFQMQARGSRNRPLTRTQLEFRGTVAGDAVRAGLGLPASVPFSGQTDWRAVMKMAPEPNRELSLRVSSSLVGLEMKLPAPLDKPASSAMPSWLEIQWPLFGGAQGRLSLGSVLSGSYALDADANGTRLAHAALNFGTGEPSSGGAQIVNVGGSVARLDLAGWLSLNRPDKNSRPLSDYLRTAKLAVAKLDYLGLEFRDLSLDLAATERSLRIAVGGPNVVGTITLPDSRDSADPWNLQFERLKIDVPEFDPGAGGSSGHGTTASVADPHGMPKINFHAAELTLSGRHFGDVQATILKLEDGVSLDQLLVTSPSFSIKAQGEWRGKGAGLGRIVGTLTSSDVQSTLKQLGYAEVIDAKSGHMEFDLSWVGAPTVDALSEATGRVKLALDKGQIVGLDPGAGRVLGIASIAALPRRLALDFSDLTDKGLAFDTVRGDFDMRDGNAYTDNVLVKGPAAEIGLIGRVGLKTKDYDQTAVVTGNLGGSPLSFAGFVGGPVVGAAVLLFTQVFKQPLKGLARGYYRITGSWDNPTVERIKSAEAANATAEAPK